MRTLLWTISASLPRGQLLPPAVWQARHRLILRLALLQALALAGLAAVRGRSWQQVVLESALVAAPLAVAALPRARRQLRSSAAATSLVLASTVLVDVCGGAPEAHFHFFVMIAVVALYQDWVAFLVTLGLTLGHHALVALLDGGHAFGHQGEGTWGWAGMHAGFVIAVSVAHLAAWHLNEQQVLRDALTELANRTMLTDFIDRTLARSGGPTSVLFIDLDDFKAVNDSRGHATGDELLRQVAERLRGCVRSGDVVARLGGDEFVLAIEGGLSVSRPVSDRVLAALDIPFRIDDRDLRVGASMGLAEGVSAPGVDAESLLRQADLAMYLAKAAGKHRVVVFAEGMEQSAKDRADLVEDLALALPHGELEVYYQPTVTVQEGTTTGWEALLRWNHPHRGMIAPVDFIPLAEESGHILAIGEWVLAAAVEQTARWSRLTGREMTIAVNLSPLQLTDDRIVTAVKETLARHDMDPTSLTLEITEGVLVHDPQSVSLRLEALRELGVRIAIDDFGTGYSSLSYLRRLPIDTVKIDRSFINDLSTGGAATTLVATIIELARSLRLDIVAEGVETVEQADLLRGLDCPMAQGYLYSRPLPATEISAIMAELVFGPADSTEPGGQAVGSGRPATSRASASVNAPA